MEQKGVANQVSRLRLAFRELGKVLLVLVALVFLRFLVWAPVDGTSDTIAAQLGTFLSVLVSLDWGVVGFRDTPTTLEFVGLPLLGFLGLTAAALILSLAVGLTFKFLTGSPRNRLVSGTWKYLAGVCTSIPIFCWATFVGIVVIQLVYETDFVRGSVGAAIDWGFVTRLTALTICFLAAYAWHQRVSPATVASPAATSPASDQEQSAPRTSNWVTATHSLIDFIETRFSELVLWSMMADVFSNSGSLWNAVFLLTLTTGGGLLNVDGQLHLQAFWWGMFLICVTMALVWGLVGLLRQMLPAVHHMGSGSEEKASQPLTTSE